MSPNCSRLFMVSAFVLPVHEEEGGLYCRSATRPQNNTTLLRGNRKVYRWNSFSLFDRDRNALVCGLVALRQAPFPRAAAPPPHHPPTLSLCCSVVGWLQDNAMKGGRPATGATQKFHSHNFSRRSCRYREPATSCGTLGCSPAAEPAAASAGPPPVAVTGGNDGARGGSVTPFRKSDAVSGSSPLATK
jgi:hypothetical protein